jgi:hypothetical protein
VVNARDLERELQTPLVTGVSRLKLSGVAAKGYTDVEINASTAKQDWEQVLTLAWQLPDTKWSNRAQGELGIITLLEGDWKQGARLIEKAFFETSSAGDYLLDRAIELARGHAWGGLSFTWPMRSRLRPIPRSERVRKQEPCWRKPSLRDVPRTGWIRKRRSRRNRARSN